MESTSSDTAMEIQTLTKPFILCPGQGAQHAGMGKAYYDQFAEARAVFDEADDTLGFKLSTLCFEGPEEELNRTDNAQAAIYVTSVACFRSLQARGEIAGIAAAAGLSLGEFTALHLAGAFDFASGLKLVRLRGQAMQEAAEASPSSMVALIGADEASANEICGEARSSDVLVPANFNAPGQVVISGSMSACERAVGVADRKGIKATMLKVAGAFHSPLMQPAADKLSVALELTTWQAPSVPVYSNVTAGLHEQTPASIRQRLVEQLTQPVRWSQSMEVAARLAGEKALSFVELAPGKVLSGLMRRIDRGSKVANYADAVAEKWMN